MYRTDRIRIDEKHELYSYLDNFARKAKCLRNASLFRIRNAFTAHSKKTLTANETEVQNELALLNGQKTYYVLGYGVLQKLMRVTSNPDFFSGLPMQTAQHIVRQTCSDFKAWLAALKVYREDAYPLQVNRRCLVTVKAIQPLTCLQTRMRLSKMECSNFQRPKFVFLCEEDMEPDSWK